MAPSSRASARPTAQRCCRPRCSAGCRTITRSGPRSSSVRSRPTATRVSRRGHRRSAFSVYAVPTTKGAVTLACVGAAAGSPDCEAIASTLRLHDARAYPLGPNPEYAAAVVTAIGPLNDARARDRAALAAAKTPAGRAPPRSELAGAYRKAASTLRRQPVSPGRQRSQRRDHRCARRRAARLPRLAAAARKGDRGAYRNASTSVAQAEGRVAGAIAALRELGYAPA